MSETPVPCRDAVAYAQGLLADALVGVAFHEAPTITGDDLMVNWAVSVQQEAQQHPITQEVMVRPVLMFNGWLGPFPNGQVVMTAIPVSLFEADDSHLLSLAIDAVRSLEAEYVRSRPALELDDQPLPTTPIVGQG